MKHIKLYEAFLGEGNSNVRVFIKKIPYESVVWDETYPGKKRPIQGETEILDVTGRKILLLDINGVNTPFYCSSGAGGKKDVPAGKWYPFFGIGFDGWFNKGSSSSEILNYYNQPLLKYYGEYLDKTIGDIRNKDFPSAKGNDFVSKKQAEEKGYPIHILHINKDLEPTDNESPNSIINFQRNVEQWKTKLKKAIS